MTHSRSLSLPSVLQVSYPITHPMSPARCLEPAVILVRCLNLEHRSTFASCSILILVRRVILVCVVVVVGACPFQQRGSLSQTVLPTQGTLSRMPRVSLYKQCYRKGDVLVYNGVLCRIHRYGCGSHSCRKWVFLLEVPRRMCFRPSYTTALWRGRLVRTSLGCSS